MKRTANGVTSGQFVISVRLPERFGIRLAPSAHNLMCSPESPLLSSCIGNISEKRHRYLVTVYKYIRFPQKVNLIIQIRKKPLFSACYPAEFCTFSRNICYLAKYISILSAALARQASTSVPGRSSFSAWKHTASSMWKNSENTRRMYPKPKSGINSAPEVVT